jgi:hypothetical protein
MRGASEREGRKAFFFEKKKQKTSVHGVRASTDKSFLVLFFKKELLASYKRKVRELPPGLFIFKREAA